MCVHFIVQGYSRHTYSEYSRTINDHTGSISFSRYQQPWNRRRDNGYRLPAILHIRASGTRGGNGKREPERAGIAIPIRRVFVAGMRMADACDPLSPRHRHFSLHGRSFFLLAHRYQITSNDQQAAPPTRHPAATRRSHQRREAHRPLPHHQQLAPEQGPAKGRLRPLRPTVARPR